MRLKSLVASSLICSSFAFAGLFESPLSADTFELKSGHRISGSVISEEKVKGKTFFVIKTDSGATLKLEKTKFVHRFFADDAVSREYEALVAKMSDTPEAHWEMHAWCKEKSRPRFRDQMDFHLQQVIRHDPNDKKARSLLQFREFGGSWINESKVLSERGYVKEGNKKWVSELQASVNDKKLKIDEELAPRRTALSRWKKSFRTKSPRQASAELFEIVNAPMVPVIAGKGHLGKAKNNPALRIIYLEAIGRVPTRQAQNLLAEYAIVDEDEKVRDRAGILLQNPELYNPHAAVGTVAKHLRSSSNERVLRAGSLLEEINSPAAILPLIGGFVTKHTISTGKDPNRTSFGQSTGGTSFSPGEGPATVERTFRNEQVAQALRSITKESGFGFDAAAWKEWYIQQHTITEYDFRRDE